MHLLKLKMNGLIQMFAFWKTNQLFLKRMNRYKKMLFKIFFILKRRVWKSLLPKMIKLNLRDKYLLFKNEDILKEEESFRRYTISQKLIRLTEIITFIILCRNKKNNLFEKVHLMILLKKTKKLKKVLEKLLNLNPIDKAHTDGAS